MQEKLSTNEVNSVETVTEPPGGNLTREIDAVVWKIRLVRDRNIKVVVITDIS